MSQLIYRQFMAWENLLKKQGFMSVVVLTMGLTLGALLCVVTLADLLLLKPLPYPEQERLYQLDHGRIGASGELENPAFNYPGMIELYKKQDVFSETALIYYGDDVMSSHPSQPALATAHVTPGWFSLLSVPMALGRGFELSEELGNYNPVAVLSHDTWRNYFAADQQILGKKVNFQGVSFTVVGVTAESFVEPQLYDTGLLSGIFLPWDYNSVSERSRQRWASTDGGLTFVGKLKPEFSATQAELQLSPMVDEQWQRQMIGIDFFRDKYIEIRLNTLQSVILGDSERTVFFLLAGVIGLVLIACANIANLFMSRTAEQQRQLAIHAVLGAKKGDIYKNLLAESSQLMALSVVFALAVAGLGFVLLQHFLGDVLPRVSELQMNGVTFVAAIVVGGLLAVFFARLSSNMINYRVLNATLQTSGKGTGFQVSKTIRQLLITSQVAIATVLVLANISLLQQSLTSIFAPLGFNVDNTVYLSLSKTTKDNTSAAQQGAILAQYSEQLSQLPQVAQVSQSDSPLNDNSYGSVKIAEQNYRVAKRRIDQHYFKMIGQSLLEGDNFSAADVRDGNKVVVINDVLAKRLVPDGSAIGSHLRSGKDIYNVIGVVRSVKMPGSSKTNHSVYFPAAQNAAVMLLKLKDSQQLSREQVIEGLNGTSPVYSIYEMTLLRDKQSRMLFSQFTTTVTTCVLALLTFFLTTIGLYGVLSYATQMRRYELGTRMAIGAKRKDVIILVIKDNAGAIGLGFGLSLMLMIGLYLGLTDMINEYLDWQLMVNLVFTLILISALTLFTCYWPLRPFINRPVVHSLRNAD